MAIGTCAAPANTAAIPTIANGAAGWWKTVAHTPPSIAPMNSVGANTPPEPPDPTVKLIATILASTSTDERREREVAVDRLLHPAVAAADHLRERERDQPGEQLRRSPA